MSEVTGIVVAHGQLAAALVDAVERISGVTGALRAVSNAGCSPDALRDRIEAVLPGRGATILFVDLASGSCAFAVLSMARTSGDATVITGVNLPMLLDFVFHRHLSVEELAERVLAKGREGATLHVPRDSIHADRPVPD